MKPKGTDNIMHVNKRVITVNNIIYTIESVRHLPNKILCKPRPIAPLLFFVEIL